MKVNKKDTNNGRRTGLGTSGAVMLAVLAGAVLSAPFVADRIEKHTLIARSKEVSQALRALIQIHPDAPYTKELEMAAWQMDAAVMNLERNNGWKALSFMERAEQVLTEMSALHVKPILAALVSVQDETELYERVIAMRQVSLF